MLRNSNRPKAPRERLRSFELTSQGRRDSNYSTIDNEDAGRRFTHRSDAAVMGSDSGLPGAVPHCEPTVGGTSSNASVQNEPVQFQPLPITDSAMAAIDWSLWWSGPSTGLEWNSHDLLSQNATQTPRGDRGQGTLSLVVDDAILQKLISVYLDHIHPSRPFLRASVIQDGMACQKYRVLPEFASMVLAIGALALLWTSTDSSSVSSSAEMISEAIRLHNTIVLGEAPSQETLQTSIYIFATLWRMKHENAAWLKLQEAIGLLRILCPSNLEKEDASSTCDWEDRARVYLELVVLER
jgi:hypothetical protein